MKRCKNIILAVGLMVASVFGATNAAMAEEILSSMTVSPPSQKMILAPGESYSGVIKISNSNESKYDLIYSAEVGSFSQTGSEGSKDDYDVVDHISKSNYNQIMDWIELEKKTGAVAPNATDILRYTINVPEDAPAGGQYATILIKDDTHSKNGAGGNIAIQNVIQFASIIYAEIAGETVRAGEVIENSVPSISFGGPIRVSSVVKNDSNVHVDAKYTLQVWPLFSANEIYTNEEDPKKSLILPETKRYNIQEWDGAPAIGIFKVRQTVEIFGNISTVEKIVIICPLWLMLVIAIIVIGGLIWLIVRIVSRKKAQNRG